MTLAAREGGRRRVELVEVVALEFCGRTAGVAEGTSNIQHRTFNVQRTLTPALSRCTGRGGKTGIRITIRIKIYGIGGIVAEEIEEGLWRKGVEEEAYFFAARGTDPAPSSKAVVPIFLWGGFDGKRLVVGAADDGLLE